MEDVYLRCTVTVSVTALLLQATKLQPTSYLNTPTTTLLTLSATVVAAATPSGIY